MSSKSKLIIGIVMLALGAGLIPTGFLTNDYLRDEVYDGVPRALRTIRDDGVEGLLPQIPVLSTPDVLKGIYDNAIEELENFVVLRSTTGVLRSIWQAMFGYWLLPYDWAYVIDAAASARVFNQTIAAAPDEGTFFNSSAFWANIGGSWFPGIAAYTGYDLNFTFHPRERLLRVGSDDVYLPGIPAFLPTVDMGSGFGKYQTVTYGLNFSANPGDDYVLDYIMGEYYIDGLHAEAIANYTQALVYYYVPFAGGWDAAYPGLSYTEAKDPSIGFYQQWANATYIQEGIDLHEFFGYNWWGESSVGPDFGEHGQKGLEAGVTFSSESPETVRVPTNIPLATASWLWWSGDSNSFTNDAGFLKWMNASEATNLKTYFSLDDTQYNQVLNWLNFFMTNVTPVALEWQGADVRDIAQGFFEQQWANGTIQGNVELSDGFLNELSPTLAGAPYFEIGLPVESNLTLAQTMALWNLGSDKTFFFSDSFNSIWYPALNNDNASQAFIMSEFGLDPGELAAVLGWLGALIGLDPTTGRITQIIEIEKGAPLATIVLLAVYEQWANGTINGEVAIPDGLLSRRSPPIYGPPYFELGLMYPIGITVAQTMALWNEASEYSLVTGSGINKWYSAKAGNTIYDDLKTQNGLGDIQMGAILEWLPVFRDVIANKLGEDDKNLPMTPYALGETLVLSLGIGGGALAALGVVLLILSRRS